MDQEEFRKLAPTLIEEGLVRKGAERAADLAEAFSTIDRDDSGFIDLVRTATDCNDCASGPSDA